jgi:hypothetical protein
VYNNLDNLIPVNLRQFAIYVYPVNYKFYLGHETAPNQIRQQRPRGGVTAKRSASELDEPSSPERKKVCVGGPPISTLLYEIEKEFKRREHEKEMMFTKWHEEWQQEGALTYSDFFPILPHF